MINSNTEKRRKSYIKCKKLCIDTAVISRNTAGFEGKPNQHETQFDKGWHVCFDGVETSNNQFVFYLAET